jgi:hypothetical protein
MYLELYENAIDCVEKPDYKTNALKTKNIHKKKLTVLFYNVDEEGYVFLESIVCPQTFIFHESAGVFDGLLSGGSITIPTSEMPVKVVVLADEEDSIPQRMTTEQFSEIFLSH